MRKILLALLVLVLAALACQKASDLTPTVAANTPTRTFTKTPTQTLAPTETPTRTPLPAPVYVRVLAETLNCRENANMNSKVLAVVPYGARFRALAFEGEWVLVRPAVGAATCWLYKEWVTDD